MSALENFPAYIRNKANVSFLDELCDRRYYKPQGCPAFSAELVRFALLLNYTSPQAYRMLLEEFPLPSVSMLKKLQAGGIDALKAAKLLRESGAISDDVMLIFDEMYLMK